jgi:hypothetical protein
MKRCVSIGCFLVLVLCIVQAQDFTMPHRLNVDADGPVYPIGWSEDSRYFAHVASPSVTQNDIENKCFRLIISDTDSNESCDVVYDSPGPETDARAKTLEEFWNNNYREIESALHEFGIIQQEYFSACWGGESCVCDEFDIKPTLDMEAEAPQEDGVYAACDLVIESTMNGADPEKRVIFRHPLEGPGERYEFSLEGILFSPTDKMAVILLVSSRDQSGAGMTSIALVHTAPHSQWVNRDFINHTRLLLDAAWDEIDSEGNRTGTTLYFTENGRSLVLENHSTEKREEYMIDEIKQDNGTALITLKNGKSVSVKFIRDEAEGTTSFLECSGLITKRFRFAGM